MNFWITFWAWVIVGSMAAFASKRLSIRPCTHGRRNGSLEQEDYLGGAEMDSGKKLPCGHVLHFWCLRDWMLQQDWCPICHSPVLNPTNRSPATTAPHVHQNAPPANGQLPTGPPMAVNQPAERNRQSPEGTPFGMAQPLSNMERWSNPAETGAANSTNSMGFENQNLDGPLQRVRALQEHVSAMAAELLYLELELVKAREAVARSTPSSSSDVGSTSQATTM